MIRFSLTQFNGGTASNVIPETCFISGTLRYFSESHLNKILGKMREIIEEVTKENDLKYEFTHSSSLPVINNEICAEYIKRVAIKQYGEEFVSSEGLPVFASEDFSCFLEKKPGAFFGRIVNHLPEYVTLHHNEYDFDDGVIEDVSLFWWNLVVDRFELGNCE